MRLCFSNSHNQSHASLVQGVNPIPYAHIPGYLAEQFIPYHDLI